MIFWEDIIEPKKQQFLSILHLLRDDALKLDKEMFNLQRITETDEVHRRKKEQLKRK